MHRPWPFGFAAVIGLAIMGVTLALQGCGARRPVVGEQKIVETSGKKPKWVKVREDTFEKKDVMYFRGMVERVHDLTLGRRQSEADAKKRIAESITSMVRTEYQDYARGANLDPQDVAKFVEDGVAWTADNVMVTGVMPRESYWEKLRITTYDGVDYAYNCYTLISLSRQDYERSRTMAINGLIEKARAAQSKAAEQAALELKRKLEAPERE